VKTCRRCGIDLPNQCPSCGTILKTATSFCSVCGEIFESDDVTAAIADKYKKPLIKARKKADQYVGPKPRDLMSCPKCKRTIAQAVAFCTYCGLKKPAEVQAELAEKSRKEAAKARIILPRPAGKAPPKPSKKAKQKPKAAVARPVKKGDRKEGRITPSPRPQKPPSPLPAQAKKIHEKITPEPQAESGAEQLASFTEQPSVDSTGNGAVYREDLPESAEEIQEKERLRASRIKVKDIKRDKVKVISIMEPPIFSQRDYQFQKPQYPNQNIDISDLMTPEGMSLVAGGGFLFGIDKIKVTLPPFFVDIKPVTNKEYYEFCQRAKHRMPWDWAHGKYLPGSGNKPVSFVSLNDARAYAYWIKKRLPTEMEWEKAAGGTDGRLYPWGDEYLDDRCLCKENNKTKIATHVFNFPEGKSPYGCFDMVGNVSEWTELFLEGNGDKNLPVLRGGCRMDSSFITTCRTRLFIADSKYLSPLIGFRCVKDVDPKTQ